MKDLKKLLLVATAALLISACNGNNNQSGSNSSQETTTSETTSQGTSENSTVTTTSAGQVTTSNGTTTSIQPTTTSAGTTTSIQPTTTSQGGTTSLPPTTTSNGGTTTSAGGTTSLPPTTTSAGGNSSSQGGTTTSAGGNSSSSFEGEPTKITKDQLEAAICAVFDEFYSLFDEPYDYSEDYEWVDDETGKYFWGGYWSDAASDDWTIEDAIYEFVYEACPAGYEIVVEPYEFDWDGDPAYEATLYKDGIVIDGASYEDDGDIYVDLNVYVDESTGEYVLDDSTGGQTHEDGNYYVSFYNPWGPKTGADATTVGAKLKDYINETAEATIVKNITATACQVMAVDAIEPYCCLTIGSSKAGGTLEFTFASSCSSVIIEAETYNKTYKDGKTGETQVSMDTNAYVKINGTKWDFAATTAPVQDTQAFDINSNKLTISNDSGKQRTYIKSITFIF